MPRPRSYRHDIRCIHCGSNWIINNGKDRGKQTVVLPGLRRPGTLRRESAAGIPKSSETKLLRCMKTEPAVALSPALWA